MLSAMSRTAEWSLQGVIDPMNLLRGNEIFDHVARKSIYAAAKARMDHQSLSVVPVGTHRAPPMVNCYAFPRFLTKSNWVCIADPASNWFEIQTEILAPCRELGIADVSEQTAVRIWATVILIRAPVNRRGVLYSVSSLFSCLISLSTTRVVPAF